jgi:hypothetical protein
VFFQRAFDCRVELFIHAFLLKGPAGTVLVDTGLVENYDALNRDVRARKGDWSGFRPAGAALLKQLEARGATPDAIVVTSFGPYAVGGLPMLPQVPIHASARGLRDVESPENPALVHPLADDVRAILLGEHVQAASDSVEILPGLRLVEVGIHHPASMALVIDTADGPMALADPVFVAENLTRGWALGAAEHVAAWHGLVRALGSVAGAIIPIHEPDPRPVARSAWHPALSKACT